ncbi:M23 family metallopeptidase [Streptomyces platensis]|uniref:M23 family metallopeptidase n=1 Tax=Streptomyces platensis TaxID=58346 RepID=UPI002B1CD457|nr:M23 family metallopeptidase [Streptomyces platensis]
MRRNPRRDQRRDRRRDPEQNPRRHSVPARAFSASFSGFTGFRGRFPRPVDGGRPRNRGRAGSGPGPLPAARRRARSSPSLPPPPRSQSPSRSRSRSRCSSPPPSSRFGSPAPLPPGARGKPKGYGPSCFFPAHAAAVLLAPATAAVLTLFAPTLAGAAAPSVSGVAGRGVERGVERLAARGAEDGLGFVAGQPVRHRVDGSVGRGTGRPVGREVDGPVLRRAERPVGREVDGPVGRGVDWAVVAGRGEVGEGVGWRPEGGAPTAPAAPPDKDRSWPVGGPAGAQPTVIRGWEPPPSPWAAGHRGVDLAASAAAVVRAAAPGRVAYAGTVAGRGVLTLEVSRSGRPPLRTTYEPVRSTVRKGQRVKAGQPVAVLQHDGPFHCREPCLHWGLRRNKTYLDPLSLLPQTMLRGGPSRLLPIFGVPVPAAGAASSPHPEPPEPTAQARSSAPTGAALLEATGLAAVAIWAFGRLPRQARRTRGGGGVEGARGTSSGEGVGERETQ